MDQLWNECPAGREIGLPSAGNAAAALRRMEVYCYESFGNCACSPAVSGQLGADCRCDAPVRGKRPACLALCPRGSNDSYLSKSKTGNRDKLLASLTKWIALAFAVLALVLNLV